jgi:murein DD-endopeptidase MepM/ murein hydrolase activator NlpD
VNNVYHRETVDVSGSVRRNRSENVYAGLRLKTNMKSSLCRSSQVSGMLQIALAFVCILSFFSPASATNKPDPILKAVRLFSTDIANGKVALLEIDLNKLGPDASGLKARFRDQSIVLIQHPVKSRGNYAGLVAIPLNVAPQKAALTLQWSNAGERRSATVSLDIIDGHYKKENLNVDPGHVKPNKKNLERIKREKEMIRRIFAGGSEKRLWFGKFKKPLDSMTTSVFGTQRLFNGRHQSYHRGTDFRARVGTPVLASNSGVVRLAENLFYSGNLVIVDHGMDIFTLYAHLSQIQVNDGQAIGRGHQIGLTGATGRVSGPHLHWAVKVNGLYVDPPQFLSVISAMLEQ